MERQSTTSTDIPSFSLISLLLHTFHLTHGVSSVDASSRSHFSSSPHHFSRVGNEELKTERLFGVLPFFFLILLFELRRCSYPTASTFK